MHANGTHCTPRCSLVACVEWTLQLISLLWWWMGDIMLREWNVFLSWSERCLWAVVLSAPPAGFDTFLPPFPALHPTASPPAVGARWPLVAPPAQLSWSDCRWVIADGWGTSNKVLIINSWLHFLVFFVFTWFIKRIFGGFEAVCWTKQDCQRHHVGL